MSRTSKVLIGGGNFSDGVSDWTSSFNDSPSSASLADLSDDSALERSYTPTPVVPDTEPTLARRSLYGSTGNLPSGTKNSSLPFRRQLSAIETQTNHLKDMLRDVLPSIKKSEDVREENVSFFAPCSTPQYKVIYKDMCEVGSSGIGSGGGQMGLRR